MNSLSQATLHTAISLAKETALRVGARIKSVAQSDEVLDITHKGVSDIVTEVDLWSEQQILEAVSKNFPDHVVVGEETSSQLAKDRGAALSSIVESEITWIVDPLDGTTNFSNKIPHSAVSIAIADHGVLMGAVVYDPYREELFEAARGEGALLNGKTIHVSKKDKLLQSVAAIGFPNDRWTKWEEYKGVTNAVIMSCRNVRACGAAAIEIAWVGCGRFEAFFEYGIKPWDIAAAGLIVEEAGGNCYSFGHQGDAQFSLFARSFMFCAPGISADLLEVIRTGKPVSNDQGNKK